MVLILVQTKQRYEEEEEETNMAMGQFGVYCTILRYSTIAMKQ